jgi:hypothetical protein
VLAITQHKVIQGVLAHRNGGLGNGCLP